MKRAAIIICLLSAALFLTSCGGSKQAVEPAAKQPVEPASDLAKEFAGAPGWVLDGGGSIEGGQAAVGVAKVGKAGIGFARTEALTDARNELARQQSLKVKDLVKRFTQSIGTGDAETVDRVSSQVSKQVAQQTLIGTRQKEMWLSPTDNLYVLVVIDNSIVKNSVKDAVQTSFRNEEALYQQFQAKMGHEELEKEVEKEFGEAKKELLPPKE